MNNFIAPLQNVSEYVLLSQKVDLIENHMNWVIGGVTLTITVLMAIFAVNQFIYQRKIESKKIEELGNKLSDEIKKQLVTAKDNLDLFVREEIRIAEEKFHKKADLINADMCRRFAIDCGKDDLNATAFDWWIAAASAYSKYDQVEMFNISVVAAKTSLIKVKEINEIDILFNSATRITNALEEIKIEHPTEVAFLKDLFEKKLASASSL